MGFSAFLGLIVCNSFTAYTQNTKVARKDHGLLAEISRYRVIDPIKFVFGFEEFILSSPSDAVKFTEFNGTIIFEI